MPTQQLYKSLIPHCKTLHKTNTGYCPSNCLIIEYLSRSDLERYPPLFLIFQLPFSAGRFPFLTGSAPGLSDYLFPEMLFLNSLPFASSTNESYSDECPNLLPPG